MQVAAIFLTGFKESPHIRSSFDAPNTHTSHMRPENESIAAGTQRNRLIRHGNAYGVSWRYAWLISFGVLAQTLGRKMFRFAQHPTHTRFDTAE